jgi:hypothetical protein
MSQLWGQCFPEGAEAWSVAYRPELGCPRWWSHALHRGCYAEHMTVRDMLTALQVLPRDAELLAFEAG